jgi:bifunctional DNA-binding transcriptional regulator/antitoxin component of YhaV-PrlF toxin-antitoxin module
MMKVVKTAIIRIDQAGRVPLPKSLRKQFDFLPGDKLRLSVEGNSFRFEPAISDGKLVREGSVLVFTGGFSGPITTARVNELIEKDHEGRTKKETRKFPKK